MTNKYFTFQQQQEQCLLNLMFLCYKTAKRYVQIPTKQLGLSRFLVHSFQGHIPMHLEDFYRHAVGTLSLYNINALCNMKTTLCGMRNGSCSIRLHYDKIRILQAWILEIEQCPAKKLSHALRKLLQNGHSCAAWS